jgi:GNAT superfamily N-acetyltransferase
MRIAECREEDVASLVGHLPSPYADSTGSHGRRFARQTAGTSTFLVAWLDDRPVGTGEVLWNGCREPEVRAVLADCPEINGLDVAERMRSRGIGTALIRHAERLAAERGRRSIGLGVDDDGNPRAAALYARLGYRPVIRYVGHWSYTDHTGVEHAVEDPGVFLAKDLRPAVLPD